MAITQPCRLEPSRLPRVWSHVVEVQRAETKSQNTADLKTAVQALWNDPPDDPPNLQICSELSQTTRAVHQGHFEHSIN